jgi:putative nucleotidyltransferase with HDIG domain
MELEYNLFFEMAAIPLDIVICLFIFLRHKKNTPTNVTLKRFAVIVTLATTVDVATAVVTSAKAAVPNVVHYIFNTVDSMLAAASGVAFIYYIYTYVKGEFKGRYIVVHILIIIDYILLLTNPITKLVFEYDSAGNYIHKELFLLVAYVFPILFFIIGSVYMFTHWRNYRRSQIIAMIIAIVLSGICFILQMLFFDDTLITFYIASIGLLIIYFSMETPYYEQLIDTMEQLQESREKEAVANAKANLSKEVMYALSQAIDAKDHYTNGHSLRVAQYGMEIAKRLGKSEKEQEDIYCMGLLHDVGKIGIRAEILNKKGKLTKEEFDIIKSHTIAGYDILKSIKEIPELAIVARSHHEKYDGTGYPDGLKGEEIPENARIICLADCYDAMTSRRSYSYPKPQAEVRAEIIRCRGNHFSPEIADVMVAIIDDDTDYQLREIDA